MDRPENNRAPYELLGGDAKVRELVDRFYDLMDFEPAYRTLRAVHGNTLDSAREKLYQFLSGWLGGPPLYTDKYGHPMVRVRPFNPDNQGTPMRRPRHLPFAIGDVERDQWMACMRQAMEETHVPQELRGPLGDAFQKTADWMRNR